MSDMSQQFADFSQGFVGGGQAGTVIGYGDPVPTLTAVEATGGRVAPSAYIRGEEPEPIYSTDLDFTGFDQEDMALLAVDLMTVGIGDYDSYFDDNDQFRPGALTSGVNTAIREAAAQAEFGFGTDFLDVLMRNSDRSPEELQALMAEKKAEARSGGGRVINYIDPVALMDAAKKSTASVTGRMATAEEQQAFVKMIHGLQASGATGINVGARAEAFARQQAPEEAKAMDYASAAGVLMQALGIRGR
tara:strand:+ start:283 stop:1023 length:741 start_codon:yes stop_codon:yes gene_type:complete